MCSRDGNKRVFRRIAGDCAVASGLLLALASCATPAGKLFPAIHPPKVWPSPPDTPRIKLIGSLSGSADLKAARSGAERLAAALRGPRPPIRFSGPHGLAVGDGSFLAVADGAAGAVHMIDLDTRSHTVVTGFGTERFISPVGVAWKDKRLFVSDAKLHEIFELEQSGRLVRRFGSDVLSRPVGIAYVAHESALYVVDGGAHDIKVFDADGVITETIGHRGEKPGEFNYPSHLCIRGDRIIVADSGNSRVQILHMDGRPIRCIGKKGNGAGDFSLPKGVAVDRDGHIYVVDAQFENVQVFDPQGRLLMAFGEEGQELGRFWLPAGLVIDDHDRIWVADSGNRRIQLFSYLRTSS